ncbi:MAG: heme transporter HemC, partial [Alphaproteobacteria bacterium]
RRMAAMFCLVGLVNLPIIYGSVYWWNTLHQAGSIVREGGPRMPASMYLPLLYMSLAYTAFYLGLILQRVRMELVAMKNRSMMMSKLSRAGD